jgi:N4-gp56 family major capsid protein
MAAYPATSMVESNGFITFPRLSKTLRVNAQPMMRLKQFARSEPAIGAEGGETVNYSKLGNLADEYATTPLSENNPIRETSISVRQGTLTVQEWGIAVPYTRKVDELADFKPGNIYQIALKNHMAKTINYRCYVALTSTWCKYTATGSDSSPTATIAGDGVSTTVARKLQGWDIRNAKKFLVDQCNAPGINSNASDGPDFEFAFIAGETVMMTLMEDATVNTGIAASQNAAYMGKGEQSPLLSGRLGTYVGVLFVKDNQAFAPVVGAANHAGEAVMIAYDSLILKTSVLPGIVSKTPTDYGRSRGVAWYGIFEADLPWGDNTDDIPSAQLSTHAIKATATGLQIRCIHFTGS